MFTRDSLFSSSELLLIKALPCLRNTKRRSRGAARAAKSLRWSVK